MGAVCRKEKGVDYRFVLELAGVLTVVSTATMFIAAVTIVCVRWVRNPSLAIADVIKALPNAAHWLVIAGLLAANLALIWLLIRCFDQLPKNPVCC